MKTLLPLLPYMFPFGIAAQAVTTFDPTSVIAPGAAPTPAEVAALDLAAGLSGAAFEDLEDAAFLPGLTITPTLGQVPPLGTCGNVSLIAEPLAAWDGSLSLNTLLSSGFPMSIQYGPGAAMVAFGVSGVDFDHELVVDGVNYGSIRSLAGFQPNVGGSNTRNLYLRIDRSPGAPITEVRLEAATGTNDCIRIDHIAVVDAAAPVPFLKGAGQFALLLAMGAAGAVLLTRRRAGAEGRGC